MTHHICRAPWHLVKRVKLASIRQLLRYSGQDLLNEATLWSVQILWMPLQRHPYTSGWIPSSTNDGKLKVAHQYQMGTVSKCSKGFRVVLGHPDSGPSWSTVLSLNLDLNPVSTNRAYIITLIIKVRRFISCNRWMIIRSAAKLKVWQKRLLISLTVTWLSRSNH